nr:AMP-binding protein [Haloferax gibbonsii]
MYGDSTQPFTFFGNAYLDAVTAPSNPEYKPRELRHSLELSQPKLLVTTSELAETAVEAAEDTSVEIIVTTDESTDFESLHQLAATADKLSATHDSGCDAVGLHMYTSGTTGPPKAVECTHENWTLSAIDFQKRMQFTHEDTLLTALPLFHANAQVYSTLGAAAAGANVVIYPKFSSSNWWDWCRKHDVTEFNAMGSMLKVLDNKPAESSDSDNPVERVFSAGTPAELIEPFEDRFSLQVVEGYSLTEDTMLVLNPVDKSKRRIGSVGLPPAEKRIQIVDKDGNPVPQGTRGEIVMDCPAIMKGYYRQPEKTAEAIQDGWFHTGDYGRIDEDGFVYFLDRKKDIVRRGGENISSFEVEGVIKALDAVDEVAVVPTPDEYYTEVVTALVKVKDGYEITETDVINQCEQHLSHFKIPRYVSFVRLFPYTPTGKIQKQQLREKEREDDITHWDRKN